MNNKNVLSYEDVNQSLELEIFGLKFDLIVDESYMKRLMNLNGDLKNANELEVIEQSIDEILGEGSYSKIKDKYKKDMKKDIDVMAWTQVITFIALKLSEYFNEIEEKSNKIKNINRYNNNNRSSRRNNYKNRNNYNRRY